MEKKIVGIFVCTLLIAATVLPVAGMMNNDKTLKKISVDNRKCMQYGFSKYFDMADCESLNKVIGKSEEEILQEIDETSDKTLVVDKELIGDRYVYYWEHRINDVQIKNDYILLHRDIHTNTIVEYIREWREIDTESLHLEYTYFEPEDIFWKNKVIFLDNSDRTYYYSFEDSQEYPIACWEVRYTDGTTIMYDYNGNKIGYGAPAPSKGFSLSGYFDYTQPKQWYWEILRKNANMWFSKWCDSTISLSLPTPNTISFYVQNPDVEYFYELAHGGSTSFQADMPGSCYYSSYVKNDMVNRQPMKFAFIGSCEGMTDTSPGTFSYEFRKGQMTNTVTVGYDHMDLYNGPWERTLLWQDYMFRKMDQGYTMKKSFDLATARFPIIAPAVVFIGDTNLKTIALHKQRNAPINAEPIYSYTFFQTSSSSDTYQFLYPLPGLQDYETSFMNFNPRSNILCVGGSGEGNYTKIQDAINDAVDSDTVFVYDDSSPYYEYIVVDKSINMIGESRDTTVIDGSGSGDVILIIADEVYISGFTVQNSGNNWDDDGIYISSNNNTIKDNIISTNQYGIYLAESSDNSIKGNNISNNTWYGIFLEESSSNNITGNNIISNNCWGIYLEYSSSNNITSNNISKNGYYGIYLEFSSNNIITSNNVSSNIENGICLSLSRSNIITGNNISSNNEDGVYLLESDSNTVSNNTILNNIFWGIRLDESNSNNIIKNTISNNYNGIEFYRSNSNTITGNIVSDSEYGVYLTDSSSNNIRKNNFLNNQRHAFFNNCRNIWKQNYWNRPQIFPKLIFGRIGILYLIPNIHEHYALIPWFNIDWRPALKPYDI